MQIRKDFFGCVYADGHRLFAGDDVPASVSVAGWLLNNSGPIVGEPHDLLSNDPVVSTTGNPVHSTEIIVEDEDFGDEEQLEIDRISRPARAASKADWFTFAESQGAIEDGATIEDYSKADLVELVGQ